MKLTKREAVLLLALLIIAILFVEYQFVYVPGMAKYERLSIENDKAQNEVNEINRLISSMPVIRARKAKALSDVATAGIPFYDQLNTDALLWNTHDLLVKSGMKAVSYSTSELGLALLDANQVKVAEQSYKLRELANAFADAGKAQSSAAATPTPTPTPTPIAAAQNSNEKTGDIEVYSVNISFLGSLRPDPCLHHQHRIPEEDDHCFDAQPRVRWNAGSAQGTDPDQLLWRHEDRYTARRKQHLDFVTLFERHRQPVRRCRRRASWSAGCAAPVRTS